MCSVQKLKTIDHQFWIDHELAKVKDANRRAFLRQQFSGDEGIERFYEMMRNRKGAVEFKNGTWSPLLPKLNKKHIETRKRACIGCGFRFVQFKPWGEVYEPHIPICPSCLKVITPAHRTTANQNSMTPPDETNPLKSIQTHRDAIQKEIQSLKAVLVKHLGDARIAFNVLTAPDVGVATSDLLNDSEIGDILETFGIPQRAKTRFAKTKRDGSNKTKTAGKRITVRDFIVAALKADGEMTRPEIETAIKKQTKKKPYNVYKYCGELLKEGIVIEPKKGTFKLK